MTDLTDRLAEALTMLLDGDRFQRGYAATSARAVLAEYREGQTRTKMVSCHCQEMFVKGGGYSPLCPIHGEGAESARNE